MIDEIVERYSVSISGFIKHLTGNVFEYEPSYTLDSLVLLDFVLDQRFESHLAASKWGTLKKEAIFLSASSYLGLCLYQIYNACLPKSKVSLVHKDNPEKITLKIGTGDLIPEAFVIDITSLLTNAYTTSQFEYALNTYIPQGLSGYRSLYCAWGILSGDAKDSIWLKYPERKNAYLQSMTRVLAERNMGTSLSKNPTASDIFDYDIMHQVLSFPPYGYDEPFMGFRLTSFLADFQSTEANTKKLKKLAYTISESKNPQWAITAYIILVAICDSGSKEFQSEFSLIFPDLLLALRPAIDTLRNSYMGMLDWSASAVLKKTDAADQILHHDIEVGAAKNFLPLDTSSFYEKSNRDYFEILDISSKEEAYLYGQRRATTPATLLHHANVCIEFGNLEEAIQTLKKLPTATLTQLEMLSYLIVHGLTGDTQSIREALNSEELPIYHKKQLFTVVLHKSDFDKYQEEEKCISTISSCVLQTLHEKEKINVGTKTQRLFWSPYLFWSRALQRKFKRLYEN